MVGIYRQWMNGPFPLGVSCMELFSLLVPQVAVFCFYHFILLGEKKKKTEKALQHLASDGRIDFTLNS